MNIALGGALTPRNNITPEVPFTAAINNSSNFSNDQLKGRIIICLPFISAVLLNSPPKMTS